MIIECYKTGIGCALFAGYLIVLAFLNVGAGCRFIAGSRLPAARHVGNGVCFSLFFLLTLSVARGESGGNAFVRRITISTANSALVLATDDGGRILELHYGSARWHPVFKRAPGRELELYPQYGDGFGENFLPEPALAATHADGNTSTDLLYVNDSAEVIGSDVKLTRIELKDPAYPFLVTLCFKSYFDEDIIEQWTEIRHDEAGTVVLHRYASCAPLLRAKDYWLTQFHGDYRSEATMEEEHLSPGIKLLDSRLGVRASRYVLPSFLISLDGAAREESGQVFGGSLEWSGSFELAFEKDPANRLRALCGINPLGAEYHLKPGAIFRTPPVLWSWSNHGKGQISRNFHHWALRYGLRDGGRPRPVLANNWESTGFNFDETTISELFGDARRIGAELFLLDDGWFGNAHPRNDDRAGLGDWQANTNKLPHGLAFLAADAKRQGIDFGIWIEPEMVNPASDLYSAYPEWAMRQPHRRPDYSRNQLDLDLSRPAVKDFVWGVVDQTLSTPGVSYVKWDANRFVTQPGSTYLPPDQQSDLLVDYNVALYDVMARMAGHFPGTMAMLCSGGGGRVDYGALKYFDLFWPSDDTDPVDRVKIQWGFSHFFPAAAIAAHVTRMGGRPLKFALDVAMSGALGVDMDLRQLTPGERRMLAAGINFYKSNLRSLVEQGDLYRLESPYEKPRAALDYVSSDRASAVLFVYQLTNAPATPVLLAGLDPQKHYLVREADLPPGINSRLPSDGTRIDGATLMRNGLLPPCHAKCDSAVITLVASQ